MADTKRKSRARIQQSSLLPPNPNPSALVDRDEWIEQAAGGFVTNSAANRGIYRVILETLWPKGHGIPGPVIDREDIRKAVDAAKEKPYIDTFRRVRELQGDEGFLGIVKQGNQYQLIDLNIYAKKMPRTHLSDDKWALVLAQYKNVCAACSWAYPEFYRPVKIPGPILRLLHQYADEHKVDASQLVAELILKKIESDQ